MGNFPIQHEVKDTGKYSNSFNKGMLTAIKKSFNLEKRRSLSVIDFNETWYIKGEPKNADPYKRNSFNLTASDKLRSDREISDIRQKE